MESPLVSILTPMYNTEKYVHRLLDSVLSQDYPAMR
jgi:glycosyltransferase involved in cell wall biosynthesis